MQRQLCTAAPAYRVQWQLCNALTVNHRGRIMQIASFDMLPLGYLGLALTKENEVGLKVNRHVTCAFSEKKNDYDFFCSYP